MSNVLSFQFHIGDFLTDALQMDATECGAYTMLMIAHYQAGEDGLPDDDEKLARIAKVTPHVWKGRIRKEVLEKKFAQNFSQNFSTNWVSKRVVDNLKKREKFLSNFEANPLENSDPSLNSGRTLPSPSSFNEVKNFKHPSTAAAREASGSGAAGGGTRATSPIYRVMDHLDADDLQKCRASAPGWDIGKLAEKFDADIEAGRRDMPHQPQHPVEYFCGFLRRYTKGKRL